MSAGLATGVRTISDAEYHSDRTALSASGARLLLPPNCPARFKYVRDNGSPQKADFDFGHAAHHMLLGVGPTIKPIAADNWRTAKAQDARAEAYANGEVPLLVKELEVVQAMVKALREHPVASKLLAPETGRAEQSLYWVDERTGTRLRGRLDWLPNPRKGTRLLITDYKTAASAEPTKFANSAADYGYHIQDVWYRAAVQALGLDPDPAFLFVAQERVPPYLVSVIELDVNAKAIGAGLMRRAIDTYAACVASDHWPSYTEDVALVALPAWYERQHEDLVT